MADNAKQTTVNVIPTMRYTDAHAAIEWLCRAFGFEKQLVVAHEDGTIAHAQLVFGNGMIMLVPPATTTSASSRSLRVNWAAWARRARTSSSKMPTSTMRERSTRARKLS